VVVDAPIPGPVRGAPPFAHVAVGAGAVWVAVKESTGGHRLLRVDPRNGDVTATVPLPDAPTALVLGRALFVGTEGGHLLRLTAGPVPRIEADASLGGRVVDMAVDETAWVTAGDGTTVELLRLDPVSGQVAARTGIPVSVVAAGRGEVWVGDYGFPRPASTGFIGQVDPRDNTLVRSTGITTAAGNGVSELSIVDGTVWALNTYTSQLTGLATAG
jgi:hypothetical protein